MRRKIFTVLMILTFILTVKNTSLAKRETRTIEETKAPYYQKEVTTTKKFRFVGHIPEYITYDDGILRGKLKKVNTRLVNPRNGEKYFVVTYNGLCTCKTGTCPTMR